MISIFCLVAVKSNMCINHTWVSACVAGEACLKDENILDPFVVDEER